MLWNFGHCCEWGLFCIVFYGSPSHRNDTLWKWFLYSFANEYKIVRTTEIWNPSFWTSFVIKLKSHDNGVFPYVFTLRRSFNFFYKIIYLWSLGCLLFSCLVRVLEQKRQERLRGQYSSISSQNNRENGLYVSRKLKPFFKPDWDNLIQNEVSGV